MEAVRSSLDLGSSLPVDVSSIESDYAKYYPVTPLADVSSPLAFLIESSANYYVQFSDSFLYLRLRILGADGSVLTSDHSVVGSFDLLSSLFSGVEIEQNGTLVSTAATLYPYRAHLTKLLSYDLGYKSTIAQQEFWYPDTAVDSMSPTTNKGYQAREAICGLSKPFELVGRLSESIFEQPRYFPPGITTKILLRKSVPEFFLDSSTTGYKLEYMNAVFFIRRHLVNESVVAYHHKILNSNQSLQYPISTFLVRGFNIKAGTTSVLSEPLFRGRIPQYLLITLASTNAVQGSLTRSCFAFSNFGVSDLSAKVDGGKLYESFNFDFGSPSQYMLGYNSLNSALLPGSNHGLTLDQYKSGNFVVCLGINPNQALYRNVLDRAGTTQLDISFKTPLTEAVTVIVVGRFQDVIEVDRNYMVSYNGHR